MSHPARRRWQGLFIEPFHSATACNCHGVWSGPRCRLRIRPMRARGLRLLLVALCTLVSAPIPSGAQPSARLTAAVVKVLGGDSIEAQVGDRVETVRYLGVRAAESSLGRTAAEFNRRLVEGQTVVLQLVGESYAQDLALLERQRRDRTEERANGGLIPGLARVSRNQRLDLSADASRQTGTLPVGHPDAVRPEVPVRVRGVEQPGDQDRGASAEEPEDAGGSDRMGEKRLAGAAEATGEEPRRELITARHAGDLGVSVAALEQHVVELDIGLRRSEQSIGLNRDTPPPLYRGARGRFAPRPRAATRPARCRSGIRARASIEPGAASARRRHHVQALSCRLRFGSLAGSCHLSWK